MLAAEEGQKKIEGNYKPIQIDVVHTIQNNRGGMRQKEILMDTAKSRLLGKRY